MAEQKPLPVTEPESGKTIELDQPGYYKGFSTLSQQAYWDEATRQVVLARMTASVPIRFFTAVEAQTMQAVVDRILPQEDRTPSRRIPILPVLDNRLSHNRIDGYRYADMPSDQDAYRQAARAFEQMAQAAHGVRFHELDTRSKEVLLQSVHEEKPIGDAALWAGMNMKRFWSLLVGDCCAAYYAHPWAWDEIGFGGPSYPRGYMRLEGGEGEPWEVDEQTYAWAAPADTISDTKDAEKAGSSADSQPSQGGTH